MSGTAGRIPSEMKRREMTLANEQETPLAEEGTLVDSPENSAEATEADAGGGMPDDPGALDDGELRITFEGDAPEEDAADEGKPAPDWVKELRRANREDKKRIKELEAQIKAAQGGEKKTDPLGKKPTLEDHDYDAEQFETALAAWFERKREHDALQAKAEEKAKAEQAAWQARLDGYAKAKESLRAPDFEDAEAAAMELLSPTQQGIIVQGAEDAARLVYALGKNPKKARELAAISDPVQFAWAAAKLEKGMRTETKRPVAPAPERRIVGTARVSGAEADLEALRAEADRTGDRSKVAAYMREMARKQA